MVGCRHSGIILITIHVYLRNFDSVDHSSNYSLSHRFSDGLINSHAQVKQYFKRGFHCKEAIDSA